MSLSSGLPAALIAVSYYVIVYIALILFKVRRDKLFLYASTPLAVIGVIWVGWAISQNGWGGMVILMMLSIATGLAWLVKRFI